ncbi:dihydroxyacetone kinase subunit DhaL [Georgenia sp. Z1491]|uniref:dihydroxyacetone kinase subunit DhaL n=1 Tax=Georgenia sp. Z1491 TaxID=3416707 RepID=UPI003CEBBAE1
MSTLGTDWALDWVSRATATIAEHRIELIDLDRAIGDADHGENLDRGFSAIAPRFETSAPATVPDVLKGVASTLMSVVGGAAGPLYGTAFLRGSKQIGEEVDAAGVAAFLEAALEGVKARGRATPGEKTMVDALAPALEAAKKVQSDGGDATAALEAAATAAQEGAEATVPLVATKGRASYLGERSAGHMDPGARSTALLLRAAADAAAAQAN